MSISSLFSEEAEYHYERLEVEYNSTGDAALCSLSRLSLCLFVSFLCLCLCFCLSVFVSVCLSFLSLFFVSVSLLASEHPCLCVSLILHSLRLSVSSVFEAYLHSPWNQLDFVIVIVSWLNLLFSQVKFLKVLRLARTLRPLRLMSKAQTMQKVITTLVAALPPVGAVIALTGFIFLIFGTTPTSRAL